MWEENTGSGDKNEASRDVAIRADEYPPEPCGAPPRCNPRVTRLHGIVGERIRRAYHSIPLPEYVYPEARIPGRSLL